MRDQERGPELQSANHHQGFFGGWVFASLAVSVLITAFCASLVKADEPPPAATQPAATSPAAATAPTEPSDTERIVNLVADLTGETDTETRKKAAVRLLQMQTDESIKALVNILERKNNGGAKAAICQAIAETQSKHPLFAPGLLALLEHEDRALNLAVVAALSNYPDPVVVSKLRAFEREQERQQLIDSLILHIKLLYERASDTQQKIELLQGWLGSSLAIERKTALEIVRDAQKKGTKPADAVIQQIRSILNDRDELVRQKLVEILRDLRDPADAPKIRAMLEHAQPVSIRTAIYNALGWLADPASIPVCVKGLEDKSDEVAAEAAGALGRLGELKPAPPAELIASAVDALVAKASTPIADPVLRESVIAAQAAIADPKSLPILVKHAGGGETIATIRQSAVRGLGQIGDASHVGLLLDRLTNDSDAGVREAAAEALGGLATQADHLKPLRDRLEPGTEASSAVQSKAWESYKSIFLKLAWADQQAGIKLWSENNQPTVDRRIELLSQLETQVSSADSIPGRLPKIREHLGDALNMGGQHAEAAKAFARAWEVIPDENVSDKARIAGKLIDSHVRVPAVDKALGLASQTKSPPEVLDAVASRLLKFVHDIAQKDAKAASDFLNKLQKAVPDQFGQPWSGQFDMQRKSLQPASQPATSPSGG